MFSLVYEGPTADELRSVGLIDIYENAYFMKNLYRRLGAKGSYLPL